MALRMCCELFLQRKYLGDFHLFMEESSNAERDTVTGEKRVCMLEM